MKTVISLIMLSFFMATTVQAKSNNGSELHANNCTRCHGSELYTRQNPRVTSLPGLGKQVRFCKSNLGLSWFDDDVADVIEYLNSSYYRFKK